jgi:hypothetical protein
MKKILLFLIVLLGQFYITNAGNELSEKALNLKNHLVFTARYDCKYGQCQAIAKSTGKQCRHCVSNYGDLYCWQH